MRTIVKYVVMDLFRNRIVLGYMLMLLFVTAGIFQMDSNITKGLMSLMNLTLIIVPLVSIIFSTIYVYNSSEFIELMLAQPIQRSALWLSIYLGLALSLCTAFVVGVGIPLLLFAFSGTGLIMLFSGVMLSVVFVGIALWASIYTRDKAKGIGIAILLWFLMTVIYDALVLAVVFQLNEYPLEKPMILLTLLNPVDLARVMILLKLDLSALMGYTGALFREFLGSKQGFTVAMLMLIIWSFLPVVYSLKKFKSKDL
jgi:Cu-processing system permease protein